ncbi:hypothetical protein NU08_4112 [Flavobacterium anhuiense]|uniref:Uncharacterized protein n=1 Tax=Flavobacterium anhuiense TaxID=459526 RepID=A0A444VT97_9FLAO|nr:hypothetical protein [Flavobacterium anhuiense]RYJ36851.1 hypothetical protein NU08_4112 [Flavobacterium anhuiense]
MKIIIKAFFDGKFVSKEEAASKYSKQFPDTLEVSKTVNDLKRNKVSNWGYIVLISEQGISTSAITVDELNIEY